MNRKKYDINMVGLAPLQTVLVLLLLFVSVTFGQTEQSKELSPSPRKDKFVNSEGLAVPWVQSGCGGRLDIVCGGDTPMITNEEFHQYARVSFYDIDGNVWHTVRSIFGDPENFKPKTDIGFHPPFNGTRYLFRIVRESQNWLEVEINDETREKKYVPLGKHLWVKTSYEFWFNRASKIVFDGTTYKLRDKPLGELIPESANVDFNTASVTKVDGDWVFVDMFAYGKMYKGWLQWRDGRKLLVGCLFNYYKIPISKISAAP